MRIRRDSPAKPPKPEILEIPTQLCNSVIPRELRSSIQKTTIVETAMRITLRLLGLLFAGLVIVSVQAFGQSAERPNWVWRAGPRYGKSTVYLRREFAVSRPVRSAKLLGVTDFADAKVFLNGREIVRIANFRLPVRSDVTPHLIKGPNVIAIFCRGADGPSATAFRMELEYRDGTRQVLVSDSACQSSSQGEEGWQDPGFRGGSGWNAPVNLGQVSEAMLPDPREDTAIKPTG